MSKVILISHIALPFIKIGSWTTLYKNYLEQEHQIDYVVCPQPHEYFDSVQYSVIKRGIVWKIRRRLLGKSYYEYAAALKKIMKPDEQYVIKIVDNPGLTKHIDRFLVENGFRQNCYVQFFYHGFGTFFDHKKSATFFRQIDEMVMLTKKSYLFYKRHFDQMPCRFSVLHNGIDTEKFHSVSPVEKQALKSKYNVSGKTVFVWCSQDRPKKGLSVLLEAWQTVYSQNKGIELWIVGVQRNWEMPGVRFFGRIPNDELPQIYQSSDVYLFPTLWQEGFGMSLVEALHCGNYCIASNLGGVSEVLQDGDLGELIDCPNMPSQWVNAIHSYLENKPQAKRISKELYSTHSWNSGMNTILSKAKKSLEKSKTRL